MVKKKHTTGDYYWKAAIAGVLLMTAWLMAAVNLLYPPIPMFLAAIAAGLIYRGRAVEAARAGALAGLAAGLPAEWMYFSLRAKLAAHAWDGMNAWEKAGLGLAELLLYAALLSFFAAFISWSTEAQKASPKIKTSESVDDHEWKSSSLPPLSAEPFSTLEPMPPAAFKTDHSDQRKKA